MALCLPARIPTFHDIAEKLDNAEAMRRLMGVWPPFAFSGVRVTEMSRDYRHVRVVLKKHRVTSNYVNTQYGGTLYSMTDPFWMIMVLNNLGREYVVWDKAGEIEYVSPGRTDVSTEFTLTEDVLDEIREATKTGDKYLCWFDNEIVDTSGTVVARVRKQLYVRRKREGDRTPQG